MYPGGDDSQEAPNIQPRDSVSQEAIGMDLEDENLLEIMEPQSKDDRTYERL